MKKAHIKILLLLPLVSSSPLSSTSAHAQAIDACQEVYFQSCVDDVAHLDEGTNINSVEQLAAVGQALVPSLKSDLILILRQRVADPAVRESMARRIAGAEVVISTDDDQMSYNPELNQVRAGMLFFRELTGAGRRNLSLFSFVQAVSHELAHSIDSCNSLTPVGTGSRYPAFYNAERMTLSQAVRNYPIGALSCLASPASVGIGMRSRGNSTQAETGAALCGKVRLNETLADYLAAEVLNAFAEKISSRLSRQQLINGFVNVYSIHCHAKNRPSAGSEGAHPNAATRVAWILLSNEGIRRQLACAPSPLERPYCR